MLCPSCGKNVGDKPMLCEPCAEAKEQAERNRSEAAAIAEIEAAARLQNEEQDVRQEELQPLAAIQEKLEASQVLLHPVALGLIGALGFCFVALFILLAL